MVTARVESRTRRSSSSLVSADSKKHSFKDLASLDHSFLGRCTGTRPTEICGRHESESHDLLEDLLRVSVPRQQQYAAGEGGGISNSANPARRLRWGVTTHRRR